MINIFKMDLFRLFKTRSFFVILFLLALNTVLFTYLVKDAFRSADPGNQSVQNEAGQNGTGQNGVIQNGTGQNGVIQNGAGQNEVTPNEPVQIETESTEVPAASDGEDNLPTITITSNEEVFSAEDENSVTLLAMLYDSSSGMLLGLFAAIFAVLFATADISNGFIKNIGGQVSSRSILILSKAFSLLVSIILLFAVHLAAQAAATQMFFGYIKLGDAAGFAGYLAVQILLHFALALFCMMTAILLKNNVISMIIAVLLCMDVPLLLCRIINQLLANIGIADFDLSLYSLTKTITSLETSPAGSVLARAIVVGICFAVFSVAVNCMIFKKRDIV